jgi:hypothetical protein
MLAACLAKAALSAAVVGVILATLRQAGPRVGGLAAAVPINSVPALFWLSVEQGSGGYAPTAALGSLWGTGLAAVLGLTFARTALVCHAAVAALLAWLTVGTLGALIWVLPSTLVPVVALALVAIPIGPAALPHLPTGPRPRCDTRAAALLSMAVAGAMSLLVSALSRHGNPQFCGLVAAIPVVGMAALYAGYRQGGAPLMLRVLRGYFDGLLAKAVFLGTLASAWMAGAGLWAWPLALAGAVVVLLGQRSLNGPDSMAIRAWALRSTGRRGSLGADLLRIFNLWRRT